MMEQDWAEKAVEEIMQPEKDWPEKAADEILEAMFGSNSDDAHVSGSVGYHQRLVIQRMMEIIRRHANEARPRLGGGRLITRKTVASVVNRELAKGRERLRHPSRNSPLHPDGYTEISPATEAFERWGLFIVGIALGAIFTVIIWKAVS